MKKQNRNVFAYARQPNVQNSEEPLLGSKVSKQSTNNTMFNEIVGQMDHNLTKYLNKLVNKNQKQQQKRKSLQKSLNHQRTKSYANIVVETPTSSKAPAQKGHSHRGSHPSTQINNIYFSLTNSPTNQKRPTEFKISEKAVQKNSFSSSFLQTLDVYITDLSINNNTIPNKKLQYLIQQPQLMHKKSSLKNRQNSLNNIKIIQRLQAVGKRQKQLTVANQLLKQQNQKLKKRLKKDKIIYKSTLRDIHNYAQTLALQLKHQKRQKKKMQQFISQFQSKFTMLRPQRKTSGAKPRIEDYLFSQTTQQQDSENQFQCASQIRSKSLKRRGMPRGTVKNSRISGFNIQQLSAMLASKNYQYQQQDMQSQHYQS